MIDPSPADSFRAGQVLSHTYEVEGVLGRGGTGEVYRARNLVEDRAVAIKALRAELARDPGFVDLMKREVRKMHGIAHDAVVHYVGGSFLESGHVILVMEFVDGPSLGDVMLRRHLDPRELLVVAHRVAQGLVATHAEGIVHRDLSPDNIVLREGDPGQAVIIDFGIAKDTRPGARTVVGDAFAGKYEYAPPEQLEGRTDPRSDLYALGASLLAAWRGEVPLRDVSPAEIMRRKQAPLDTGGVPEPLRGLIDWLSAPDPARRPGDAASVVARVEAALDDVRPRAEDVGRRPRRRRWLWASLPLGALAAAVAAWGAGWIGGPPVADPWILNAVHVAQGEARLEGHVPDEEAAEMLQRAFEEATGREPQTNLVRADGTPTPAWPEQVARLLGTLGAAERWDLGLEGMEGHVEGLVPDVAGRDALVKALDRWAEETGVALAHEVAAGPEWLPASDVQAILDRIGTCGSLVQGVEPDRVYALGDTLEVLGSVGRPEEEEEIEEALAPEIGDRHIAMNLKELSEEACAVRAVLPRGLLDEHQEGGSSGGETSLSIWLGDGETGASNHNGIYTAGENPIADVLVRNDVEGSLWVMIIDTTGQVFHVLPTSERPEHELQKIGEVEDGVRRIRVLYPSDERRRDGTLPAFEITSDDWGRTEILAILTEQPLFDIHRPLNGESVNSLIEALVAALDGREDEIRGVATRIIEARQ